MQRPEPKGIKPEWSPPTYFYNPTTAGKCRITDHVTDHSIDCDDPGQMYLYQCNTIDSIKTLQRDIIDQCKEWR